MHMDPALSWIRLVHVKRTKTAMPRSGHALSATDCAAHALHQALENRTLDSKREMDIMNALDEMKSLKARQERVDSSALLSALKRGAEEDGPALDDDDEAAVRPLSASACVEAAWGGWNDRCSCAC